MKLALIAIAVCGAGALSGCNSSSQTAITAAICTDATALQASGLALNSAEATGLQGIVTACAATSGGTVFNNTTVAEAIIDDAILLQQSGLLNDIHITAEVTERQRVAIKKIDMDYAKLKAAGLVR